MKHKNYIEESLLKIGAEKYKKDTYKYKNVTIKIYKDSQLSDILLQLINAGAQLQVWEVENRLTTPIKVK